MPGMRSVSFNLHNALTRWPASPFALSTLAVLIGLAYLYLLGDWRLAERGRRWPQQRTAAFLAGLVAVDAALQSPVATFTGSYFQAHVLQHLLLMVVAPPLLALGAPSTLLLQTASRRTKRRWLTILRSRPFAVLTHPIPVWFLYFGFMFAFFLSSLINLAMHHMALMDLFNVIFLLGGCLYWWPLVGRDPIRHWKMGYGARMFNVLLGGPPEVILGLAILSARTPIASMYSLSSTHAGGGLLWISTEFVTIAAFIPIFWQWMRSDQRAAARADAQNDAQGAVDRAEARAPSRPVPVIAATNTSLQDLRSDWSGVRLSAWEAMWRAKTGRVPYLHAYSVEAMQAAKGATQTDSGGGAGQPQAEST
jgi:putative membrane protein